MNSILLQSILLVSIQLVEFGRHVVVISTLLEEVSLLSVRTGLAGGRELGKGAGSAMEARGSLLVEAVFLSVVGVHRVI